MKKLSDSEKEIMDVVWEKGEPVCVGDVCSLLDDSEWKYTTVATFMTRLMKKGFLVCKKEKNQNHFTAAISREEYLQTQTDEFVKEMYDGKAGRLIASLCKDRVSESDYNELLDILKKYGEN